MARDVISVIIPVYRVENYLYQCLASIAAQSYESLEILCVDDCGGDGSLAIAEDFVRQDSRFKIIRQPRNLGVAEARNTGLERSTGKYVSFVDADDWLHPRMLEKMHDAIDAYHLDSVWIKWLYYLEDQERLVYDANHHYNHFSEGFIDIEIRDLADYPTVTWNKLYNREFLVRNGLKYPKALLYEDNEFFFKCFCLSPRTYLLDEYLYNYRKRPDFIMHLSNAGSSGRADSLCDVARNCMAFLKQRGMFEKHAADLLDFIGQQIESFVFCRHYKEDLIKGIQTVLAEFGFPDTCRTAKRYAFFNAVHHYRPSRYIPGFAIPMSTMEKIIPFKTLRYWFMVYCLKNDGIIYEDMIDYQSPPEQRIVFTPTVSFRPVTVQPV